MKSGNSQQQQRHFNPRVNYNHASQSPVLVPPIQPQATPPQQQPHLYSRNQAYLSSHPVDMPPVETVVARLETACRLLHGIGNNNTKVAEISSEIQILSDDLRRVGPHLELAYPDVLDRVMSSMRDASAQPCLPPHLRLAIFELVELRASKWLLPSDSSNYYRQRRSGHDDVESAELASSHAKPGSQGAASQEKSDGKTYREEILIKNSDSGKVNASAKERVLSINGYSQQSINMAKSLIHETINRNSSPVFDSSAAAVIDKKIAGHSSTVASSESELETNSVGSAGGGDVTSTGQFTYTVAINDEVIKVSGNNFTLVQEAKLALDDYFSSKYNLYPEIDLEEMEASVANGLKSERNSEETKNIQKYSREDLLTIEANLMSIKPNFAHLDQTIQDAIVLKSPKRISQIKGKVPSSSPSTTAA